MPPGARAPCRDQPSGSPCTMRGASLGCRATVAWTASYASAVSAAHREPRMSQPTCTTVVTPTAAALASPSSTVPDCMSRWVWESATGTRRGSGSGGAAFLSPRVEVGMPRSYERGMPSRLGERSVGLAVIGGQEVRQMPVMAALLDLGFLTALGRRHPDRP